ncbi:IS66-like element accessory protein TnpA [Azohydromonas caseinilytica]|uniref:Transposase n=1 Tax=Azohydromonas caseinilytica TaxID=2728836 RepID=A0A848FLE3_9BURK|nr:transposase [Azohydromonas caseinilytica]
MYSRSNPRRRHDAEFKAAVVAACDEPGASVAAVAQAHGLNANLVHQWRRGRGASAITAATPVTAAVMEATAVAAAAPVFIPVELPAPTPAPTAAVPAPTPVPDVPQEIHIELRRGAVTVSVRWPMQAAGQCATWLREILR